MTVNEYSRTTPAASGNSQQGPTLTDLAGTYAPHKCEQYVEACLSKMYLGNAPTMRKVRDVLGDNAINAWLSGQLEYMFSLTDISFDQNRINDLVRLIRAKYQWLKLTEFMHFVFLFRTAEFGKVYGKTDGQDVMLALKDYCRKREAIIDSLKVEPPREKSQPRAQMTEDVTAIIAVLTSPQFASYGQWRKEPWAEMLSRSYSRWLEMAKPTDPAEIERHFPGNWTYEQRKAQAKAMGYVEQQQTTA